MTKIHISTSVALSPTMHDKVEAWLTQRYGEHASVYHVDAALIGGIVIFDGEKVYDGSIKGKLNQLKL